MYAPSDCASPPPSGSQLSPLDSFTDSMRQAVSSGLKRTHAIRQDMHEANWTFQRLGVSFTIMRQHLFFVSFLFLLFLKS